MTDSTIPVRSKYNKTLYGVRRSNLDHGTLVLYYYIPGNIFGDLTPETYTFAKDYFKRVAQGSNFDF